MVCQSPNEVRFIDKSRLRAKKILLLGKIILFSQKLWRERDFVLICTNGLFDSLGTGCRIFWLRDTIYNHFS